MNYLDYVYAYQKIYLDAKRGYQKDILPLSLLSTDFAPKSLLILAPHPDDECLMSGFAIRAQEEFRTKVSVLPFSYGSLKARRLERKQELMKALALLNFELYDPRDDDKGDLLASANELEVLSPEQLKKAISTFKPDCIIAPHEHDGHPLHKSLGALVLEYVTEMNKELQEKIALLQSEYWQSVENPNLLIPLSSTHVSKLCEALSMHEKEVARNPYHLTLPATFMDQARRGFEMASTKREAKSDELVFAQVYRRVF